MKNSLILFVVMLLLLAACTAVKAKPVPVVTPQPLPYGMPIIVAHRGARSVAPENTLLAARRAFGFSAEQWELDVQLTRDGELIVLHDPGLMRTSDVLQKFPLRFFWQVKNFTLAEIKTLDAGSWYVKKDPFGEITNGALSPEEQLQIKDTGFPTLREALELTKELGWSVNVEIKDISKTPGDAVIVQKTVALIQELNMVENVLISSFKHDYLKQVKALNPNIQTAALVSEMEDPITLLRSLGADAINPDFHKIKDLGIIKEIRDAGFDVYVWTVNDENEMMQCINAGVSGIITDYPQRMVDVLVKYE